MFQQFQGEGWGVTLSLISDEAASFSPSPATLNTCPEAKSPQIPTGLGRGKERRTDWSGVDD